MENENITSNCPFCGSTDKTIDNKIGQLALEIWEHPYGYQITCSICGCRGPEGKTRKRAVKKWNNRSPIVQQQLSAESSDSTLPNGNVR